MGKKRVKAIAVVVAMVTVMSTVLVGCGNSDSSSDKNAVDAQQSTEIHAAIQKETDSPDWVKNLPAAQDANTKQLFVVAGMAMDRTTAFVSMHEKDANGNWKQILSTPGFVGKNGLCMDDAHVEGCGQTPIGTYKFNKAFGIANDPGCAIPYTKVTNDIYWSGDPNYKYNEMVDIKDYPTLNMEDSEHIIEYEYPYQYCLNISFNEAGTPGRGSAIFLHSFGTQKPYTGGCVSVPEYIMKQVMQKVKADCVVVIDTVDNLHVEY
ncbi:MAG: L,D-transpeptidase family protein [Lachnospiraceae bacterium]|nr:L,D-transpeptidase family protein [Lachnospiraceae bacterium]